ncbi:MAG: hypothetical protein LAO51_14005, partial [Acidobacteriia bacterium]|nr:hypothetical protein [Terriglobia bacterium]
MRATPRWIVLAHAEIDGVASPEERTELERHLAAKPEARAEFESLRRLAETLARVEAAEPPSDLRANVMRSVRASAARERPPRGRRAWHFEWARLRTMMMGRESRHAFPYEGGEGEGKMAQGTIGKQRGIRIAIVGAAAVVVAALVVYLGGIYPPRHEDVVGTIGAADRHVTEQIGSADVQVENGEAQRWLQSEEFARLVADPEARGIVTSEAFRRAMSDAAVRKVFADAAVRDAFADAAVRDAFARSAVRDAFARAAVRDALADAAVRDALADAAVRDAFANPAFRNAFADAAARDAARKNAAVRDAMANAAVRDAFANAAIRRAFADAAVRDAFWECRIGIVADGDMLSPGQTSVSRADQPRSPRFIEHPLPPNRTEQVAIRQLDNL